MGTENPEQDLFWRLRRPGGPTAEDLRATARDVERDAIERHGPPDPDGLQHGSFGLAAVFAELAGRFELDEGAAA
jgi:hypothetical protein